ncbi:MAG: putative DNA modification/repair radical SAM protein, partial [Bacilli bacterium]|nr:putative DNA modification/repair radical SAM protein [Bacilli bacterium]
NIQEKLKILADSAKYDASCSSSGSNRSNKGGIGNAAETGICHSFSSDGRCISLLKILLTNACIYDCKYCINRKSNNIKRAIFTPEEICEITINFYRRNYIEGLFLSSGIVKSPDYTMEQLIKTIELLRNKYHFNGYIHAKAIPGASDKLLKRLGSLVDRLSANIELPTESGLKLLAPNKESKNVREIMAYVKNNQSRKYVPAGQSTQMIIGATKESDLDIMNKSSSLYDGYKLKRVFYSAYIPVNKDSNLPSLISPPLVRENRLYQADWLLRFYNFKVGDLLDEENPNFNVLIDPKTDWALRHLDQFPKEVNKCSYYDLLKIPGIGVKSAKRIVTSRRNFTIQMEDLKRLGVVMKRAKYFILCNGKYFTDSSFFKKNFIEANLVLEEKDMGIVKREQLRLF